MVKRNKIMRQKVAKRLRREAKRLTTGEYAQHHYLPSNPDIGAIIDRVGLESVVRARGSAPLSFRLKEGCAKLVYKELKRNYR